MAPKHSVTSFDGGASKKKKAITMEAKLDIVKQSQKGETATNIDQLLGLSHLTAASNRYICVYILSFPVRDKDIFLLNYKPVNF